MKEVRIEFAELEKKMEKAAEVVMDKWAEEWMGERNEWKALWEE